MNKKQKIRIKILEEIVRALIANSPKNPWYQRPYNSINNMGSESIYSTAQLQKSPAILQTKENPIMLEQAESKPLIIGNQKLEQNQTQVIENKNIQSKPQPMVFKQKIQTVPRALPAEVTKKLPPHAGMTPSLMTSPPVKRDTTQQADYESLGLEKVKSFLLDPAVISIECSGPDKQILVNKSGQIQATSMIMSKEEIRKVLENLSEKTKIPLTQGVFKALFQNLMITAVVSEFIGDRFMIQKRNPFTN